MVDNCVHSTILTAVYCIPFVLVSVSSTLHILWYILRSQIYMAGILYRMSFQRSLRQTFMRDRINGVRGDGH